MCDLGWSAIGDWMAGENVTLKQYMRMQANRIDREKRVIDRTIRSCETDEKKLLAEGQANVKLGRPEAAQTAILTALRLRRQARQLAQQKQMMTSVQSQLNLATSQQAIQNIMTNMTRALTMANRALPVARMQNVQEKYVEGMDMMKQKDEVMTQGMLEADANAMMSDQAMPSAASVEDRQEAERIMAEFMEAAGLSVRAQLPVPPAQPPQVITPVTSVPPAPKPAQAPPAPKPAQAPLAPAPAPTNNNTEFSADQEELMARLNQLKTSNNTNKK